MMAASRLPWGWHGCLLCTTAPLVCELPELPSGKKNFESGSSPSSCVLAYQAN